MASALAPLTERLRFLVAVRPGLQTPSVAARMAATLDRISDGRLLINVVTGGDPVELKGDGLFLDHSARYEVTDEFLRVWRRAAGRRDGRPRRASICTSKAGRLFFPPVQKPYPPLYFGGSSEAGHRDRGRAGRHLPDLGRAAGRRGAEDRDARRRAAADVAAQLRFGIRLHVIVRETAAEAWAEADRLIAHVDDAGSPRPRKSSPAWIRWASSG